MAEAHDQMTVIGADTHIKGEMTFGATARILGTFEGKITAKGEVQVAAGATCKAAIEATTIAVDGTVEGNIHARERLTLNAKARIEGDIVASKLVVAEGAAFTGHCRVGPEAAKGGAAPTGANQQSGAEPKVVTVPREERQAAAR